MGLGNPGREYVNTRHNIGFQLLDYIAGKNGYCFSREKFNGSCAELMINGEKVLLGKLTPAQSKEYHKNELFIVEGNSACGTAKSGRDKLHQAILPLRGKIINCEKSTVADLFKNEEINTKINEQLNVYDYCYSLNVL